MFDKIYQPHQVLFRAGDPANALFEVHSGQILCLKSFNHRLVPVFLAVKGDTIGESAMVPESSYNYHAVALVQSQVSHLDDVSFHRDLTQCAGWLTELLTTMLNRYEHTTKLVTENRVVQYEEVFNERMEIEFKKILGMSK